VESIINNEYWNVTGGNDPGGVPDWQITVTSQSSMPVDARFFHVSDRVFIRGEAADGTSTLTAWKVQAVTANANDITLDLISENANSNLPAARLANPVKGLLIRGVPNVNDYEEFCDTIPGLNTNDLNQFWLETTRMALACEDERYKQYHKLLMEGNPQYKMFGNIENVEWNKQIGMDFQRRFANAVFYNKKLANQSIASYNSLEQITTPTVASLSIPDEGRCVGRRANAEGVIEQLAECGRVFDLQGQILNLPELHNEIYNMQRVREANGMPADSFDLFTDSYYCKQIENAYINYFRAKAGGDFRLTWDSKAKSNRFGFKFKTIELDWPNVELNLVSHKFFDDLVSAAQASPLVDGKVGREVWLLNMADVKIGVAGSNRVTLSSGDLSDLAKVDSTYLCVMKVARRSQTLTSMTYTVILECPESHLVLQNINGAVPEHVGTSGDAEDFVGTVAA